MEVELFGAWEAADFFGVTKQAFFHWRRKDPLFPPPEAELRSGPVWTRGQLESYQKQRVGTVGRLNAEATRAALELAVKQFSFYAQQHRDKCSETLSPDKIKNTIGKAIVNEELVEIFEAVLRGEYPEALRE